ncbi:hypothetical protein HFO94_08250 [Rhizobium leguminosarum]|uniref:Uncharacterized protein n=1 Tax=Rhizobium laguerreae TaxID=1076926 RepID=A0A7Y2R9Z4_9HYPH|nr:MULTISPECIES: hypothetical protein [Rhizobium]MBY5353532.1 hypothetical protein [Rhizobium leguminosarum]MBY5365734.1 hypothetical protein [Rhizobium leguminosarum]MBY5445215.1 hypothetical protein [Rhizobium leguminosarum]MBY5449179.1 hypothetical protein [Rhizobium leguminosarum]NDK50714.1 hypothetical protein [Rhizobium laguerreae]
MDPATPQALMGAIQAGVNDMDYQIAFAATVATASFLFFMLIVHRI